MKTLITLFLCGASLVHAQDTAAPVENKPYVYLARRVTISSESGMASFNQGTRIQTISKADGKITGRTDDGRDIVVEELDVTTDPVLVEEVKAEAREQRHLTAATMAAQAAAVQKNREEAEALRQASLNNQKIKQLQTALSKAQAEKDQVEKARKDSVRRGNDVESIENLARKEREAALKKSITALKEELKMMTGENSYASK